MLANEVDDIFLYLLHRHKRNLLYDISKYVIHNKYHNAAQLILTSLGDHNTREISSKHKLPYQSNLVPRIVVVVTLVISFNTNVRTRLCVCLKPYGPILVY